MEDKSFDKRSKGQIQREVSSRPLNMWRLSSWAYELDDSPGLEIRALFRGGALLDGRGCGGDGGVGPTCVSYLRGVGAVGTGST